MGDHHCSNIVIMQLFHELKQQFPTLPDTVITDCIYQHSHDRETCIKSLQAAQKTRPSPGAFPPPGPQTQDERISSCILGMGNLHNSHRPRPHRPASLDIATTAAGPTAASNRRLSTSAPHALPASAPASCLPGRFFPEQSTLESNDNITSAPVIAQNPSFQVNVNVACNAANAPVTYVNPSLEPTPYRVSPNEGTEPLHPRSSEPQRRSFTSVSLTLRPPSSEPQPPVTITSQGPNLRYSSSSTNPRGFQSRLQISIGPGNVGGVFASRIRSTNPSRNLEVPDLQNYNAGTSFVDSRETGVMSAPTTPCISTAKLIPTPSSSLPSTPLENYFQPKESEFQAILSDPSFQALLQQVPESKKDLIIEQAVRKSRLAKAFDNELKKLESMKKEVDSLTKPLDPNVSPKELEKRLRNDIHQLQIECDRLAVEVDQKSDPRVPLGETNEEFYQGIYTGQQYVPVRRNTPPPLPSEPPAWQPLNIENENQDVDGPSWVCLRCTFNNHPLMDKCEQCDSPKITPSNQGETQDIHIRVTHRHNFPPRTTVHDWVS